MSASLTAIAATTRLPAIPAHGELATTVPASPTCTTTARTKATARCRASSVASTAAALGILLAAVATAASLGEVRGTSDRVAAGEVAAEAMAQLRERQWFGTGDQPEEPYHRLLAYSAVRMYELPATTDPHFRYAISAGTFVLLVHEATNARARPSLSGQLESWRGQLGRTARVEAFVVVPGGRPPRMSSVDRTRFGYELATETTFVDLVWTLFAGERTVSYPINSVLLRRAVRSAEQEA
jgi:hypothetical protein